ncbi:protein BIG GRAIN 1-like [Phragmites australis]|uniref:protein BIG GRAIN 1-like n=1 Tax=Phragmites australis TaxID=29695 RepID=UPI002D7A0C94|nr:protein BIG GRAIN 1-like [Phragmites australis]
MERWGAKGVAPATGRTRRYADQPSFSSTLLDAIYKSMDEPDGGAKAVTAATAQETKKRDEALHYSYYYRASLAGSYRARAPATAPGPHATTSSSSECSSYGGFSSSEAESSQHRRLRPIRTSGFSGGAPAPEKKATKKPGANIRAKLRDLRKPASPGARLAGFLNSIFNGKRAPSASRAAGESACSTASSYSRSCLSKTPSTRGQPKRTVRFLDSDSEAPAAVPADMERRRVQVGVVELEQMLLHRMEMDSDEDDESSDASSDLFELENLAAVAPGAGGAGAYRDELPVYETTRVVLNRAVGHGHGHGHGHGYAHGRSTRVV